MNENELDYLLDGEIAGLAGASASDERIQGFEVEQLQQLKENIAMAKAITAGEGVYGPGSTGWSATKPEYILDGLTDARYSDRNIKLFPTLKLRNVSQQTVQFLERTDIGDQGDGFSLETGADGLFNHGLENDPDYKRESENVAITYDARRVSFMATMTDGMVKAEPEQQKAAIRNIKGKITRGLYYSSNRTNKSGFNGLFEQILQGVRMNPQGRNIALVDADGKALSNAWMNQLFAEQANALTRPTVGWLNPRDYANWQNTFIDRQRSGQEVTGQTGQNVDRIINQYDNDPLILKPDAFLKANMPHRLFGRGADGKPRDENTADANALVFATTPFTAAAAVAAGNTGTYFYNFLTYNDMDTALAAAPPVPAGTDGYAVNQLLGGNYYYAVSAVYMGRESRLWVYGCTGVAASNTLGATGPTAISPTTGQVVRLTLDDACITGLGTTIRRDLVRFRVYRADATATKISDFNLLFECGVPKTGDAICYDNGWRKPGTRDILLLCEEWDGMDLTLFAQQVAPVRRQIPGSLFSDVFGYITAGTPILRRRVETPSHVWIRNVGDTPR